MNSFAIIHRGIYRHNKTDKLYEVLGVALQTESNEPLVVYRPLWESEYQFFARPYTMFTEEVNINGQRLPRFEKVDD